LDQGVVSIAWVKKRELVVLHGDNYDTWEYDIVTSLKRKEMWQFTKMVDHDPKDEHEKFTVSVKEDEVEGFMTNHISKGIWFHPSGIDCPNEEAKEILVQQSR
jgi:ABC-type Zn uptake system ZnuABC Zn-binding protein ZnuA